MLFTEEKFPKNQYKGFSGFYGSYAQKGWQSQYAPSSYDSRSSNKRKNGFCYRFHKKTQY